MRAVCPRRLAVLVGAAAAAVACASPPASSGDPADAFGGELGFATKADLHEDKDGAQSDVATAETLGADAESDVVPDDDASDGAAAEALDTGATDDGQGPEVAAAADVTSDDAGADAPADAADDATASDAGTDAAADGGAALLPAALCWPCAVDADCQGGGAVCVAYGAAGSFCGLACAKSTDCPSGFACAEAEGTAGAAASKQCLLKAGECPCTPGAIAAAAATPCSSGNAFGSCKGKRVCGANGLSACSAQIASAESCDGKDDNCDGVTDPPGANGCSSFWPDNDGDGVGAGSPVCLCSAGLALSPSSTDCNDNAAAIFPGAAESCNDIDDDCDGKTDNGCDSDGDGWCNAAAAVNGKPKVCVLGVGDCNDKSALTHPGQTEVCGNGQDDNCDGATDSGQGGPGCVAFFADSDSDGYGAGPSVCACAAAGDYTAAVDGDCDDSDPAVHPGASEVCGNTKDDNCSGAKDEGAGVGCSSFFVDGDGDGFGTGAGTCLCVADVAHPASSDGDCNDLLATISPAAKESCNGVDDNCNGSIDDGPPVDCTLFFADADLDGYGGGPGLCLCAADAKHPVATGGDCDDSAKAIHPGAGEVCNTVDDNCNGTTDEIGAKGCKLFHADADKDGYGGADQQCACAADPVYVSLDASDCADGNAAVHPGAAEVCDGLDNNCDGVTDPAGIDNCTNYFLDGDADGYGNVQAQVKCLCSAVGLFSAITPGDCNDAAGAIHPGATALCNSLDDNCDGEIDNGAGTFYYQDADNDGYGNATVALQSCDPIATFVTNKLDCNDGKTAIHPGALEVCDGVDNDCSGQADDGTCVDSNACTLDACIPGSGCTHTVTSGACNDGNACTFGDTCASGTCVGTTGGCDDGNACTSDSCGAGSVCGHVNNTLACNDGNACTSGDTCGGGACAGIALSCDDGNACTTDSCSGGGCQHLQNTGACSDNNACTGGDVCAAGSCAGTAISCNDNNPCTTDACATASGCSHVQTCTSGLPWADGGSNYACGLSSSGTIKCWGSAAPTPTGTFSQIAAGYYDACAVRSDHVLVCWEMYPLGDGATNIAQVSVGDLHACAIKTDQTLQCWGSSSYTNAPAGQFTQVSCGGQHTCAVRVDGVVLCWGNNTWKQLNVPAGNTFQKVAAGKYSSCGIRSDGSIKCWGDVTDAIYLNAPTTGSYADISSYNHVCAVRTDGGIVCWGTDLYGETAPPAGGTWINVAVGDAISCGVRSDKSVACWGNNADGQASVPSTGW